MTNKNQDMVEEKKELSELAEIFVFEDFKKVKKWLKDHDNRLIDQTLDLVLEKLSKKRIGDITGKMTDVDWGFNRCVEKDHQIVEGLKVTGKE